MTNDTNQADTKQNGTREDNRKYLLLLLLLFLLIVGVIVWYVFWADGDERGSMADSGQASTQPTTQPGGERFEFSTFYHAENGTWAIEDAEILVLKERKFITASEKDAYTVHEVQPTDAVRIVEARQRWKRVEILRDGKVVATGWIDANHVRHAQSVELPIVSQ